MAELRDKALAAIEEAAGDAVKRHKVVPRTLALRFAFAFLANFSEDRSNFDDLWQALTTPPLDDTFVSGFGRRQTINACMNGLYHELGLPRR